MAQVAHATTEFAFNMTSHFNKWLIDSKYIVVLAVEDLKALTTLAKELKEAGLRISLNHEPDLDYQLTALAISPEDFDKAKKMVRKIPLAFAEKPTKS